MNTNNILILLAAALVAVILCLIVVVVILKNLKDEVKSIKQINELKFKDIRYTLELNSKTIANILDDLFQIRRELITHQHGTIKIKTTKAKKKTK